MASEFVQVELSKQEGLDIVYRDNDDYEIISEKIVDQRRWTTDYYLILHRESDDTYWGLGYDVGSTEMCEQDPFEYETPVLTQLEKVEVTTYEYRPVRAK